MLPVECLTFEVDWLTSYVTALQCAVYQHYLQLRDPYGTRDPFLRPSWTQKSSVVFSQFSRGDSVRVGKTLGTKRRDAQVHTPGLSY